MRLEQLLKNLIFLERQLQNSICIKIVLLIPDSDFTQIAYDQNDMSICEKPNRGQNHQFLSAKRVLQLPLNTILNFISYTKELSCNYLLRNGGQDQ